MADTISKIDVLIEEITNNRNELHGMLGDLTSLRKNVDSLLPKKMDYRNKFLLEERMKSITSLMSTELAIRKHIDSSLKDEIRLRSADDTDDSSTYYDALVKAIEDGKISIDKHDE